MQPVHLLMAGAVLLNLDVMLAVLAFGRCKKRVEEVKFRTVGDIVDRD